MGTFLQDLRFTFRNLRRTPAFPLAAIATLALGIGATTAIFSTVNAVLLRPLPYPNPNDLYGLRTALTDGRVTTGLLAPSEVVRLNDPNLAIERAAGVQQADFTLLRDEGIPHRVFVYFASEGFFELFDLPMTIGGFKPEHFVQNSPPVVVISPRMWKELFGNDPNVVGKPVRFAELTATVVGVAPKNFDTPHDADFWVGGQFDPQGIAHFLDAYMRLKPGTTLERAKQQMDGVMSGLLRDFPASAKSRIYVPRPLVESIVGDLGAILIVVLSATGLLLVLACVNVTNLLLARGAARAREMAVRVALGAGRGRIVRQLLTESVLLATAGALVGLAVASAGVRLLLSIGASQLPRLDDVPFDGSVLMFALLALVVSGIFVGFAPALRLASTDVRTLMNESSRSASAGKGTARWLSTMTVAEIALAITLVAGAGWLVRSFANLSAIDPGFDPRRRLAFDVSLQGPRYRDAQTVIASLNDMFTRLRGVPGVVNAGGTSNFPLRATPQNTLFAQFRGEPMDPAHPINTRQRTVTAGFFETLGIKVIAGRDFNAGDRNDTQRVALVNRTFVRRYVPNREPLGMYVSFGYPAINPNSESMIVGVVEDVRQENLMTPAEPAIYSLYGQGFFPRMTVVVHAKSDDTVALQAAVRDEMQRLDPQMAVDFSDVPEAVSSTLKRQELGMLLMLLFGAVAVALAAVGIYGVVAYASAQRRNEVATRLALGASSGNVFWLVLRQGCTLAAIGTAIGLSVAYLSGRFVSSHVPAVQAWDPAILSGATVLVAAIAVLATMIPAYRAARLDPSRVLRPE